MILILQYSCEDMSKGKWVSGKWWVGWWVIGRWSAVLIKHDDLLGWAKELNLSQLNLPGYYIVKRRVRLLGQN